MTRGGLSWLGPLREEDERRDDEGRNCKDIERVDVCKNRCLLLDQAVQARVRMFRSVECAHASLHQLAHESRGQVQKLRIAACCVTDERDLMHLCPLNKHRL